MPVQWKTPSSSTAKRIELGVMQVDVMQNALAGKKQFQSPRGYGSPYSLYPNVIQIVTLKDSPINTFADLKGKKVSVGFPRQRHSSPRTRSSSRPWVCP